MRLIIQLRRYVLCASSGCAAVVVAASLLAETHPAAAQSNPICVVFLHHSDGESQLIDNGNALEGGAAHFVSVVERERRDANINGCTGDGFSGDAMKRIVLTLNAGDTFIPSPEFTASLESDDRFFDSRLLGRIRYDALAIGNHEFDLGPDVFAELVEGIAGPAPYVSANLDFSLEPVLQALVDRGDIASSVVVRSKGETIGIIGATTDELRLISSPRDVVVNEVLPAVQAEIAALQAAGVEKIVLLSHLQNITNELDLVAQLAGIDVVIGGGGDELLANSQEELLPSDDFANRFGDYPQVAQRPDAADVPVVTTPGDYQYLGRLEVEFMDGEVIAFGGGPVRVIGGDVPDAVDEDRFTVKQVVEPVQTFVEDLASVVIGDTEVFLNGQRDPGVRTQESNLGNLMADSLLTTATSLAAQFGVAEPDVALQNGGGIRDSIDAGPITVLDTFNVAQFFNLVTIVPDVPREQFKQLLERAVSAGVKDPPSAGLLPAGQFAQIAGFSFTYDVDGQAQELDADGNITTAGERVRDVTLDDGTMIVVNGVVQTGDPIDIGTIDFLARGGDGYPFADAPFTTVGVTYQQALRDMIEDTLGGLVTATDYPEGGEGRITRLP